MGGNTFTGLGSADHHSSRDMRELEADDRPTDETNRKSLFPADKNSHILNAKLKEIVGQKHIFGLFCISGSLCNVTQQRKGMLCLQNIF